MWIMLFWGTFAGAATVRDCDQVTADPGARGRSCGGVCMIVGVGANQELVCDVPDPPMPADYINFGVCPVNLTRGYLMSVSGVGAWEYQVWGSDAGRGAPISFCCAVDDNAGTIAQVSLTGTWAPDDLLLACNIPGAYGGCSAPFQMTAASGALGTNVTVQVDGGDPLPGCSGGPRDDILYGSNATSFLYHEVLLGGAGGDMILGNDGDDLIYGEAGDDTIVGGGGNDAILGGDGTDNLRGMDGSDVVLGGNGNDWLQGGVGFDKLCDASGATKFTGDDVTPYIDEGYVLGNATLIAGSAMGGVTNYCQVSSLGVPGGAAALPGCALAIGNPIAVCEELLP